MCKFVCGCVHKHAGARRGQKSVSRAGVTGSFMSSQGSSAKTFLQLSNFFEFSFEVCQGEGSPDFPVGQTSCLLTWP